MLGEGFRKVPPPGPNHQTAHEGGATQNRGTPGHSTTPSSWGSEGTTDRASPFASELFTADSGIARTSGM